MINNPQKYSNYKPSGVEWLGDIPEHWEATKVKNVFRLVVEPAPKNNDFELLSVYTEIGVKPRRELEERGNKASTTDGYWFVKKGDIVVNKLLAWMGAIGVSDYDGVTSPAYDILRAKVQINSNYYHYLFRNEVCIAELKKHSRGIMDMRLRLYFDKFGDIVIPFPDFLTQQKIVEFLDRKTAQIDQAIAIKVKQIELLKERRQILIHQAVTKGIKSDVKMKDSGVEWIGEIPEHWEVKRLKYVADIVYGISPNEKTYNDIGLGSVLVNGPVEYSEAAFGYTRSLKWTTSPVKFAEKGSLLFCLRGSTTGRLNICHQDLSIGRGCAAIMAKGNHDFLIKSIIALKDRIVETFKGSTFPSVTSSDLDNYSVPLPPIDEQEQIVTRIENLSQKIATAISLKEQEIEKMKEYKSVLINGAVTGKVRV